MRAVCCEHGHGRQEAGWAGGGGTFATDLEAAAAGGAAERLERPVQGRSLTCLQVR